MKLFTVRKGTPITGPEGPRGFQEVKVPRFRDRMAVGCQPYAPAAFTPRKCTWYSFLLEAESCDRKNCMSMKNPLTLAGIEPATFRFVAQHLNHCATAVPIYCKRKYNSFPWMYTYAQSLVPSVKVLIPQAFDIIYQLLKSKMRNSFFFCLQHHQNPVIS